MNSKPKTIHVEYYAILREQRGCHKETLLTQAVTLKQLYEELQKRFGFNLSSHLLRVAVNNEFKNWSTAININDKVVFIPPVAGG